MEVVRPVYRGEKEFTQQFEECFKQYFKALCFHALSFLKDEDVARDITHDVFLTVWKQRAEIDFSRPMLPYLFSLIRNRSLNYLEHQRIKTRHQEYELQHSVLFAEQDYTEHEELIREILNCIEHLPVRCREVIKLSFVEGKKYKEIAALLGISLNTVKTHISTGLKILRNEFPSSLLFILIYRLRKQ